MGYQDKGEKMDEEECQMKEAFANLQVSKDHNAKKKKLASEKKSLTSDKDVANERLSILETQLMTRQRSDKASKNDIAKIKAKWEKNKGMMEIDIDGYSEKLSSMTKAMTEDDMVSHELDSKISETMMKAEEVKEGIKKEKDSTEKSAAKLMAAYDHLKKNANE